MASVCLSICLCLCLSVCLSICLSFSLSPSVSLLRGNINKKRQLDNLAVPAPSHRLTLGEITRRRDNWHPCCSSLSLSTPTHPRTCTLSVCTLRSPSLPQEAYEPNTYAIQVEARQKVAMATLSWALFSFSYGAQPNSISCWVQLYDTSLKMHLPNLTNTHTRARARSHIFTHTHTHTLTYTHTHTHTHTQSHTHTHTHSHTHTHTHTHSHT